MVKPSIPPEELQRFELQRSLAETGAQIAANIRPLDKAHQFREDFGRLARAIVDPDWHKPPKPHGDPRLPPFRTTALSRRLPFGPLRRMAKLIGPHSLRYVFLVGSDDYADLYRVELRRRLDKEFRHGNHYKRSGNELDLIAFGHAVLTIERDQGSARGEALELAAESLNMTASKRTLERDFKRFRQICERRGYVPHPNEWMGSRPYFSLGDLDGRASDKPEK